MRAGKIPDIVGRKSKTHLLLQFIGEAIHEYSKLIRQSLVIWVILDIVQDPLYLKSGVRQVEIIHTTSHLSSIDPLPGV